MFGKLTFVPASGGKAVEHLVSQRLTFVGRDKDCSIRVEDDSVDAKQFVISCSGQAKIQNLSQKLPTQVNQKSIGLREDQELKDKDTISFGKRQFVWTMSTSSGRRDPPRHDCLKGKRVSEPVRKVAVVTPNRRELPLEEDWTAMPPDAKRRRTMIDPSAPTPEPSSFSRRVKYDKQLKQKMGTPSRRKHSVGRTPTPAINSAKKRSISFAQPLESPQLTYNHESAFNKSITPGRFYRRNDGPFQFRGFNPVPEEPMSPGLLSGCDSFLSMDDSQMTRRSSARVSTPYPNKSMRGSSQLHKTPQSAGPSGMYFESIQEEMTHRNQHDATPSSYFSSTSGSPRMMRAESPTVSPGGSGSPFQGRKSLVQSSRSSSYGTPREQSLHSLNDSMYVNATGSSQMRIHDFEGSSMNQSRYSWTTEGMSSPRPDSFANTPPSMRTPRRSRVPLESPGSAAFSPNPSEADTSGYVLLSPRGRGIINRAFNRNDMSLQLSPQHSPSRRLFRFSQRTPDNRRHGEPGQSLSVQVLTKSLRKKLNRTPSSVNSPHNPSGTPISGGRGKTPKQSEAFAEIPITPETVLLNGTPKSTRSASSKRAALHQTSEPDLSRVSRKLSSIAPSPSSPVGASKRKSSVRSDGDSPSSTPLRTLSRLSGKSSDLHPPSTPVVALNSEPKKSTKGASTDKKKSVADGSASLSAAPRQSRSSKRSLVLSPRPSSEPDVPRTSRKSINVETSSPVGTSDRKSSVKGNENGTPQSKLPRSSLRVSARQSSEPDLSRLSRKSSDLRKSIPSTPAEVPYSEPKRSIKGTPNSESTNKRVSVGNELVGTPPPKAAPRQSRLSKLSQGATPRQSSEPDLSRSSRTSGSLRNSALQLTPVSASKDAPKRSLKATPKSTPKRNSTKQDAGNVSVEAMPRLSRSSSLTLGTSPSPASEPGSSRSSRKPTDLNSSNLTSSTVTPSPPKRSNTFTLDSPRQVEKQETSQKSPTQSNTRASARVVLSPDKVTPPSASVVVNLRSSRKLSTKKKDSPSKPLTASKVLAKHKRTLAKSLSVDSVVNASPKSSLRNSLPVSLGRFDRKSRTSLVQGKAQAKRPGSRSASESPAKGKLSIVSNRRSRASLVGDAAQLLHLSASPSGPKKTPTSTLPDIIVIPPTPTQTRSASATPASGGPVRKRRSSRSSGAPSVLSLPTGIRKTSVGKRSSLNSETHEGSGSGNRRSRASLVGDAAQLLHLASPSSPKKTPSSTVPDTNVTPPSPAPTRSAGATASGGPVLGRRSSRRTRTPSVRSLASGIRNTSVGKRSSRYSETSEASGSVVQGSPKKSGPSSSNRSSRRSSDGEPAAALGISSPTVFSPRMSRSSSESEALVTPPRSVKPEVVMRSSRKTSCVQDGVPSTPTSAVRRRNARRSSKRSPVPSASIQKKLSLISPRKDSVKKLSLDPEKPDKNKMAALIACHKKKSPVKAQRRSTSSSEENASPGKGSPENLTPLKDLDVQPEERSPEDALLDALDLSRKSAIVEEPKRPSRRLRSSTNRRISAQSSAPGSSKSTPASPPKSVKKLLFKSPLVEYEGSHQKAERSPSRSLKGILMPSPTTASEEPMSRVFTTSPVVDFTDASGRKKIFRASPNSKSKAGGIRELLPDEESDLNIFTLFEASSSDSGPSGRKRKGSEPTDTTPPKKTNSPEDLDLSTSPRTTNRKRASEGDTVVLSSKRSRKATTAKLASPTSTRRNLQEQFEQGSESPKSPSTCDSPKPSTSKAASLKVSPKQLSKASVKAKAASNAQTTKKAPVQSNVGGVKPRKLTPVKSPAKTRRAADKSPKKSLPKRPPRAGKAGKTVQPSKPASSKAKPKKAAPPARGKAQLKASGNKVRKSSSPAKSPLRTRRGAVAAKSPKKAAPTKSESKSSKASKSSTPAASPAMTRRKAGVKSPKKAVQAAKGQPKSAGRKAVASSPAESPPKTRRVAAVKSPKKAVQKAPPKAGKTGKPAKSPAKPTPSERKVVQKAPPKAGKPAKSPAKAGPSKGKVVQKAPPRAGKPAKSSAKATPSKRKAVQKAPPKAGKPAKSPAKASTSKAKSPAKAITSKAKSPTKASRAKPKKVSASSPQKPSPKKTRGKLANAKAEAPKPVLAKPKANQGAKPKTAPKTKARLSVPPKPLKGKAVGAKNPSPRKSPKQTRSRKAAAASTSQSSRGKR